MRPELAAQSAHTQDARAAKHARVLQLHEQGLSLSLIARRLHLGTHTVRAVLLTAGLTPYAAKDTDTTGVAV